jgi:hypothetical protein
VSRGCRGVHMLTPESAAAAGRDLEQVIICLQMASLPESALCAVVARFVHLPSLGKNIRLKRRSIIIAVTAITLVGTFLAFRPHRLFNKHIIDENMPATFAIGREPSEAGSFHKALHPMNGVASTYQATDGTRVLRFTTSNVPASVVAHLEEFRVSVAELVPGSAEFVGARTIETGLREGLVRSCASRELCALRRAGGRAGVRRICSEER